MNKQEAIQKQIDEIMDCFDFRRCCDALNAIKLGTAKHEPFEEYSLRADARKRMKDAVSSNGFSHTGPFMATYKEGSDEDGPWVRVELHCVIGHWPNDGVSYDAEADND